MAIISEQRQYIMIEPGKCFTFESEGQTYNNAKFIEVQQGSVLIETENGDPEAITLETMRLLIKLVPENKRHQILPAQPDIKNQVAIAFPLNCTGIRAYTRQGISYASPIYEGVVPVSPAVAPPPYSQPTSVTLVNIGVPTTVEILTHADGSQSVNIYEQGKYPGQNFGASPPTIPPYTPGNFYEEQAQQLEDQRLAYLKQQQKLDERFLIDENGDIFRLE